MFTLQRKEDKNKTERFNLRLSKEEKRKLQELSEKTNLSMSDILVQLINLQHGKIAKS